MSQELTRIKKHLREKGFTSADTLKSRIKKYKKSSDKGTLPDLHVEKGFYRSFKDKRAMNKDRIKIQVRGTTVDTAKKALEIIKPSLPKGASLKRYDNLVEATYLVEGTRRPTSAHRALSSRPATR